MTRTLGPIEAHAVRCEAARTDYNCGRISLAELRTRIYLSKQLLEASETPRSSEKEARRPATPRLPQLLHRRRSRRLLNRLRPYTLH